MPTIECRAALDSGGRCRRRLGAATRKRAGRTSSDAAARCGLKLIMSEPADTSATAGVARKHMRRALRILNWASMGVCIVLLGLWGGSTQYDMASGMRGYPGSTRWVFAVYEGGFMLVVYHFDADSDALKQLQADGFSTYRVWAWPPRGWHVERIIRGRSAIRAKYPFWPRLTSSSYPHPCKSACTCGRGENCHLVGAEFGHHELWLPIWAPLLVIAVPTAMLFWRDRRRIAPGHCRKCDYNLRGNVSGVCPECGTPT